MFARQCVQSRRLQFVFLQCRVCTVCLVCTVYMVSMKVLVQKQKFTQSIVGKVHYVEYVLHSQYMWCSVYSSQLLQIFMYEQSEVCLKYVVMKMCSAVRFVQHSTVCGMSYCVVGVVCRLWYVSAVCTMCLVWQNIGAQGTECTVWAFLCLQQSTYSTAGIAYVW